MHPYDIKVFCVVSNAKATRILFCLLPVNGIMKEIGQLRYKIKRVGGVSVDGSRKALKK